MSPHLPVSPSSPSSPSTGIPRRSVSAAAAWRVPVAAAVIAQYLLGVTTLLLVVPVSIATLHQSGAVILLTAVLVLVHRLSSTHRQRTETQPVLEMTLP